jgi:hypothetical protein
MALPLRLFVVLLLLLAVAVGVAYVVWSMSIGRDLATLRADARAPIGGGLITAERLAGLPPAALRYFTRSGIVGTAIPRLIRLEQKGRIRSAADAGWMPLGAEEVYSTDPPAFVWRAGMPGLALPVVLGRDEYLGGEGSIEMRLLSLLPVASERGEALRAAGLLRYLNEMMWFPAAYLGDNVAIFPVSDDAFGVRITDRGLTAEATLFVDAEGRLTNFRASRYNTSTRRMEIWETPLSAWGELAGLELPRAGAADWKLATGDLRYIELEVTSVAYEP